jgi:hypothetical protein
MSFMKGSCGFDSFITGLCAVIGVLAGTAFAGGPLDGAIILLQCVGQAGGPGDTIACSFKWVAYNPFTGQPITGINTGFPEVPNTTVVTVQNLPNGPIEIPRPPPASRPVRS